MSFGRRFSPLPSFLVFLLNTDNIVIVAVIEAFLDLIAPIFFSFRCPAQFFVHTAVYG